MTADSACELPMNTRIYIYARTQHSTSTARAGGKQVRLHHCAINFPQSDFLLNLNI